MEEEIREEFEKNGFSIEADSGVLGRCVTFCINFKMSPADLVSHWEIYYLNRQLEGLRVEEGQMDGFLSHIQNDVKERTIKEERNLHVYSSSDLDLLLNGEIDSTIKGVIDTPSTHYERSHLNPISTPTTDETHSTKKESDAAIARITPFGQRMTKFTSQFTFSPCQASGKDENAKPTQASEVMEDDVIRRVQPSERCSLQVYSSQPEPGCKYMCNSIGDRFDYLENRLKRHTNAFAATGSYGDPKDATWASQTSLFTVGMVCCDGQGHLNDKSVLLQGSVEQSGGQRVRLDLHKLPHFSLFPGQIIGIQGHNPSGHCLVASNVIDALPKTLDADAPPAKKQEIDQNNQILSLNASRMLSMIIAAGPFTTIDNLSFEPLAELLAFASRKHTQLLILLGPFIDREHPEIKKGTVDKTFGDVFYDEVVKRIQDYCRFIGSTARVILVPSARDANHDFVFPQPAFDIHLPEDANYQISSLANPNVFSANEILVGCCTVDILKQLSSEETSRSPPDAPPSDRMARLASQLLRQRSFYPLYPPAAGVPLDFSLAPEALEISIDLDLLVLPSDLAPFVKVISVGDDSSNETVRCLCVNPGRLAKGIGGGTFVELIYKHDPDRTTASIIRI